MRSPRASSKEFSLWEHRQIRKISEPSPCLSSSYTKMPSLKAQTEPVACLQRKSAAVGEGIGVTKLSDINCGGRAEMEEDTKEIRWKRRLHKSLALAEVLNISTIVSQVGKER